MQQETDSMIYIKEKDCPVCKKKFKISVAKTSAIRIESKDSDFMVNYKTVNPLLYEVYTCSHCGYSALMSYFDKINVVQIKKIKEKVSSKWVTRNFPEEHTVEDAIMFFKIAYLNAVFKDSTHGEKALLSLKLSWLYRLSGDTEKEISYQKDALSYFELAYLNESFPLGGLDEGHIVYLMGELCRRIGDTQKALVHFSNVLVSVNADRKLKDRVRAQKDLILSEKEAV